MRPELEKRGIHIIALSKDSIEDAARATARDKLGFVVLSDPKLEVIGAYGLLHHKAVEFSTMPITVLGIPLGMYTGRRTMAVPTTLLIDEHGVVRWIDQADDYRLRGDAARVNAAIDSVWASS